MSEGAVMAIVMASIAAVPPTLVAWAALVQARKTAVKLDVAVVKADDAMVKAEDAVVQAKTTGETILTKTAEIHELTNSNLTAVKTELAMALQQIKDLQRLVAALTDPKRITFPQKLE